MALTYNKRDLDGVALSIGQAKPGVAERVTQMLNSAEGQTTIGIGVATVNVDVDPALHGRPLLVSLNGVLATGAADATATSITSARWSASVSGRFSINVNANATAIVGVSYRVSAPLPA